MTDKKAPLDLSDMDAAPDPDEDGAGPDDALKVEQDSDAQVYDKHQSLVEQDSGAHIDVGLQKKHQSPAEQVPDENTKWMEGLAPEVTRRIQYLLEIEMKFRQVKLPKEFYEKLKALVANRAEVTKELEAKYAKYNEEKKELEAEYEDYHKALYTERSKIVNGEVDVQSNIYETAEEATSDEKATKVKGIPNFWLTAMKNNEVLAKKITSRDEKALKYLKDIVFDPLELKLDFYFDKNPFFDNSILMLTLIDEDEDEYEPSTGCRTKIKWHQGKRLTHEVTKKKPKKCHPKHKTKKRDSFFDFFEVDEDGIDLFVVDGEDIRDILKDKIIPKAALWYAGKATSGEDSDESESVEDSDEDESESAEGSDEDEDEGNRKETNKRTRVEGPPASMKDMAKRTRVEGPPASMNDMAKRTRV